MNSLDCQRLDIHLFDLTRRILKVQMGVTGATQVNPVHIFFPDPWNLIWTQLQNESDICHLSYRDGLEQQQSRTRNNLIYKEIYFSNKCKKCMSMQIKIVLSCKLNWFLACFVFISEIYHSSMVRLLSQEQDSQAASIIFLFIFTSSPFIIQHIECCVWTALPCQCGRCILHECCFFLIKTWDQHLEKKAIP